MRYLFLILIWFTPAAIAGMLGWSGIWGTGSAFIEYLIPVPVAGGVFHLPGLVVSFILLRLLDDETSNMHQWIAYGAFAVFVVMLTLHIDFERFYSWITTDYQPSGSPIRFESNALLLFTLTDAFFVWVYALTRGVSFNQTHLLLAICAPPVVMLLQVAALKFSGPEFTFGGTAPTDSRAQETQFVFTTAQYDEAVLLGWLDEKSVVSPPWMNSNTEHQAIVFTNSMQLIKRRSFEEIDSSNTIATVCSYEEDQSRSIHKGLYDCFAGQKTLQMKIDKIISERAIGLHVWVDDWYARTILCEEVAIPTTRTRHYVALYNTCINLSTDFDRTMKRFEDVLRDNPEGLAFVRARVSELGLPRMIPPIQRQ